MDFSATEKLQISWIWLHWGIQEKIRNEAELS